jgi:hypothetical protein
LNNKDKQATEMEEIFFQQQNQLYKVVMMLSNDYQVPRLNNPTASYIVYQNGQ